MSNLRDLLEDQIIRDGIAGDTTVLAELLLMLPNSVIQSALTSDDQFKMSKSEKIAMIKAIIATWGSVSTSELELESSPCLNSIGEGNQNTSELIEDFYRNTVSAITYNSEVEIAWNEYGYEALPAFIIDEIYKIMLEYEAQGVREELQSCISKIE